MTSSWWGEVSAEINLHLLAARAAKRRIFKIHLGDEPRPIPAPKLHELRVLVLDDNDVLWRLRCLVLLDPPELSTYRRRDRAVTMNATFKTEGDVCDEHGEELDAGDELVIAAEAGVRIAAVKNFSIRN